MCKKPVLIVKPGINLASIILSAKNLQISGYLEGLKKDMIEQNEDIIDLTKETPEFSYKEIEIKVPVN